MRLGICTNMNTTDMDDLGLSQIPYCKQLGLEYIELSLDRVMRYDDERFTALVRTVSAQSLPCLVCNNFIPPGIRLIGDDYRQGVFEAYIIKALERAAALGAGKVVFGSAAARNVPSHVPMELAHRQLYERLCFVADVAQNIGIEIEVEHLNRLESNIINTFEESVALAKRLNRPNVKSIFDYYHFALGGEQEKLIKHNKDWIGHIHFACTLGRHMPDIHDVKNMNHIFSVIRGIKYDDTFSFEAYFPRLRMDDLNYKQVVAFVKDALCQPTDAQ